MRERMQSVKDGMSGVRKVTVLLGVLILLGTGLHAGIAAAQTSGEQRDGNDPPSRVARISFAQGNVSLEPAGVNTFSQAEMNYPLTAGDRIYVDNAGLSELQTAGLAVRLGNGADLTLTSLTDQTAQLGLAQGSIRVRTRDLYAPDGQQGVVEIDTPNGTVLVERSGDVRVDSYPQDDTSVVTVSSGSVEISGQGFNQTLGPNQALRLAGTNPVYTEPLSLLPPDELDRFDQQRDRRHEGSGSLREGYVSPEMIGAADLDEYGEWRPSPEYGQVWYPRAVPVEWAPYRNGHWAWVAPWGWTWIESEPWGFAPFHYGRWANFDGRWGWVPGPPPDVYGGRPLRPIYSPALVAFVGGPRFSVSLGFGGGPGAGITAWFPLGPREPYTPWYHSSPSYVNRVNVTNIYNRNVTEVRNVYNNHTTNIYNTNVTNVTYVNRPGATTAVAQRDFAAGRPVAAAAQQVHLDATARSQLNRAPLLPHPLVTPSAGSAAPQTPARALPPNQARPVLVTHNAMAGAAIAPINHNAPQPPATHPPQGTTPPRGAYPQQRDHQPLQPAPGTTQAAVANQPPATRQPATQPTRPAQPPLTTAAPRNPQSPPTITTPRPPQPPATTAAPRAPLPVTPVRAPVAQPPVAGTSTPNVQTRIAPRPPDQPRPLVNRGNPQPVQPPFAQQQRAIQRIDPGRPLGPQQVDNLRNGRPAGPVQQPEAIAHPAPAEPQRSPRPGGGGPENKGAPPRRPEPQK